jgi:monofunctional biosynthetic peptidoglycan transglycosylase
MGRFRKLTKYRLVKLLIILLILPYFLIPLYRFTPPVSAPMVGRWITFNHVERNWISLKQVSPNLIKAVIASEDLAFCQHHGFDFDQLGKSWEKSMRRNAPIRATSTITQQTVKNLFFWSGRSWIRKILEIPLTLWMEIWLPKKRIFEIYLNVAEWGDGIYGVEAASFYHFHKQAAILNIYEASLLAKALPNPIERNPSHPGPGLIDLAADTQIKVLTIGADLSCLR